MNQFIDALFDSLCGGSEECKQALREVYSLFEGVEEVVRRLPKPVLRSFEEPLAGNVANRDEVVREAEALGVGEELSDYVVKRVTALEFGWVKPRGLKCPVCGQAPSLVLLEEEPSVGFAKQRAKARCICGYEREFERFTCPSCGSAGRQNFEVYVSRRTHAKLFVCRNCGYAFLEIPRNGLSESELQGVHASIRLVLKAGDTTRTHAPE
ncbi:formate dehydrogenase accessory protein FdhE domain-containing protein [Thermofilum pendens]|uniref:Formate dehydrogenase accessory protein FdhE n=1 Tax=Thermofilum pendens (strain DSM 2475 / Hrk 5) TaxID=368408 RepID=A1S028_THEPD|nr:formate dehydrogenase accessory protein FdhE [Thermofilum pendens]ABL78808.1 hypothetical protein Tpen_1411 [Thermofilum pendens Hrk 5]